MKKKHRVGRTTNRAGLLDGSDPTSLKSSAGFAELTNEAWLLTIALGLAAPGVSALGDQSVSLAWDASSSIDVMGYEVHYGTVSRAYTDSLDVGDSTTTTVSGL